MQTQNYLSQKGDDLELKERPNSKCRIPNKISKFY